MYNIKVYLNNKFFIGNLVGHSSSNCLNILLNNVEVQFFEHWQNKAYINVKFSSDYSVGVLKNCFLILSKDKHSVNIHYDYINSISIEDHRNIKIDELLNINT